MKRRARHRERRSALGRTLRRARRALNRIRLGPDYVAAMVAVFAGISFVAGLAVGTSSGSARPEVSDSARSNASTAPASTGGQAALWIRPDNQADREAAADGAAPAGNLGDLSISGRSSLLDPAHFSGTDQTAPPKRAPALITQDLMGLEEPLLPQP